MKSRYLKEKCDPYIDDYLFATQLLVGVLVDLLEDIGGGRGVADVDQLHVEQEGGLWRDHIPGTLIPIAQLGRNGQFALLTW